MKKFNEPIQVTRPLFPRLKDYVGNLEDVWESQWLSNGGKQHQLLEKELQAHMGAPNISLFNNGTIALLTAIQSLRLQGEVITTPFSFPATTHALQWNNITPVFCDLDEHRLTIDPLKIESLITSKTSAILGVHVYGVPCHVREIQQIADRHGLRVIYDAAHAFGTQIGGHPIASFGDISMFSFHPTKLFHTGEGGALVYNDDNLKQRIEYLKNFGIKNEEEVILPGINGKMSEVQASLGRTVLPLVEEERAKRAQLRAVYKEIFKLNENIVVIDPGEDVVNSEQYFCIRIKAKDNEINRDYVYEQLKTLNIFSRKYFYPLISSYPCYKNLKSAESSNLPVAEQAAKEVLCLPFYGSLGVDAVSSIAGEVVKIVN
ncbi:DegT/DnrJ/EryC1/StrS family aminotransferase [Alteromonas sp. 345S023]|uniref:DegT/DnrJ/EryC1/StrS family aminotransferase n=1 Tax=Alteromonas profundi TaxID=2696062 RepID=A0A7X5LL76_9ALTE|nr:DegT/DnrJ/EryC1/StrS family aminotransferase [Alteromonas profundi]NDV91403.1 DegT/DnrJ/EryC1/StrS family aminotransferase [Alteromonas profundi]